eukprot:TRINITY_DN16929_c0_g1_i1.p1 TRINITY_DN16929_c0_g1~~TRINITY_DN16929_c0_g1_i1.p1  ORF type:complete len:488 (+),score=139.85 TRINITY_DN16929_c0_g1_i1:90-1466(+)
MADRALHEVFVHFCGGAPPVKSATGKAPPGGLQKPELDGAHWAKMCRELHLLDDKFKSTDADLAFAKARPTGQRKVGWKEFRDVLLEQSAQKKGIERKELAQAIVDAGGSLAAAAASQAGGARSGYSGAGGKAADTYSRLAAGQPPPRRSLAGAAGAEEEGPQTFTAGDAVTLREEAVQAYQAEGFHFSCAQTMNAITPGTTGDVVRVYEAEGETWVTVASKQPNGTVRQGDYPAKDLKHHSARAFAAAVAASHGAAAKRVDSTPKLEKKGSGGKVEKKGSGGQLTKKGSGGTGAMSPHGGSFRSGASASPLRTGSGRGAASPKTTVTSPKAPGSPRQGGSTAKQKQPAAAAPAAASSWAFVAKKKPEDKPAPQAAEPDRPAASAGSQFAVVSGTGFDVTCGRIIEEEDPEAQVQTSREVRESAQHSEYERAWRREHPDEQPALARGRGDLSEALAET